MTYTLPTVAGMGATKLTREGGLQTKMFKHFRRYSALVQRGAAREILGGSQRLVLPIGLSHARPNSGISGDLLSENEAKPAVI